MAGRFGVGLLGVEGVILDMGRTLRSRVVRVDVGDLAVRDCWAGVVVGDWTSHGVTYGVVEVSKVMFEMEEEGQVESGGKRKGREGKNMKRKIFEDIKRKKIVMSVYK